MFGGHRRHQTCNKLHVSHYNRSLLSHNDQASNKPLYRCCAWQKQSHQTSTGAKWQITPLPVWESLFHSRFSLSLFPFLDLFVSLSTRSPFLPLGLSSLSFLTPRCRLSVFLSAFILAAPLLFLLTFIFPISPNPSLRLSVTSCYLGRPDSLPDAGNGRWLTLLSLPRSNTPRVGQDEARPRASISVMVTMQSGRLTAGFGKLTGFTALVQ